MLKDALTHNVYYFPLDKNHVSYVKKNCLNHTVVFVNMFWRHIQSLKCKKDATNK